MRGLTLILVAPEPARFRAALRLAAAAAALGRPTRLFLDEDAVPVVAAATMPGALLATAWDLGVRLILCQTGLAAAGLDLRTLDPRMEAGGLVSLLAEAQDDDLVTM